MSKQTPDAPAPGTLVRSKSRCGFGQVELTRRDFLSHGSFVLGVTAFASGAGVWSALSGAPPAGLASAHAPLSALGEVLSFHLDQPYIDITGAAQPYSPPQGARSAQGLAELSDEQLRTLYFCV
jgi:hypothetical protein